MTHDWISIHAEMFLSSSDEGHGRATKAVTVLHSSVILAKCQLSASRQDKGRKTAKQRRDTHQSQLFQPSFGE